MSPEVREHLRGVTCTSETVVQVIAMLPAICQIAYPKVHWHVPSVCQMNLLREITSAIEEAILTETKSTYFSAGITRSEFIHKLVRKYNWNDFMDKEFCQAFYNTCKELDTKYLALLKEYELC